MSPAEENEKLFERFQKKGDLRALARLFDRTAPELLRVATYLCGESDRLTLLRSSSV